jgi:hypothetical protein
VFSSLEARTFPSTRFSPPEPVDFACVAGSLSGKLTSPNFVSLEDQKRTLQCSALTLRQKGKWHELGGNILEQNQTAVMSRFFLFVAVAAAVSTATAIDISKSSEHALTAQLANLRQKKTNTQVTSALFLFFLKLKMRYAWCCLGRVAYICLDGWYSLPEIVGDGHSRSEPRYLDLAQEFVEQEEQRGSGLVRGSGSYSPLFVSPLLPAPASRSHCTAAPSAVPHARTQLLLLWRPVVEMQPLPEYDPLHEDDRLHGRCGSRL